MRDLEREASKALEVRSLRNRGSRVGDELVGDGDDLHGVDESDGAFVGFEIKRELLGCVDEILFEDDGGSV